MVCCNVNIPYYGKARLLLEAAKSVSCQTAPQNLIELTIIDDASPERVPASLSLNGSRWHVIRNDSNLGMVANWNHCLGHGECECVHLLHGDDLLDHRFYSLVLPVFEKHKNVGLVHTDSRRVVARKTSVEYWGAVLRRRGPAKTHVQVYPAGDPAVRHVMRGVTCSAVVLRREAVRDVGLFRTDLPYSSDEEYWARVAERWGVAHLPLPLVTYRYHAGNYQLKTWQTPDFWEKMTETHRARLGHLARLTTEEVAAQDRRLARAAASISLGVLAAGNRALAAKYLQHAVEADPQIVGDKIFRRASRCLARGHLGRVEAWLRSAH